MSFQYLHEEKSNEPVNENEYEENRIPPNWELSKKHAIARSVAQESERQSGEQKEICECCGYETDRIPLKICCNLQEMNFLGSGFPLFYNYIKYCLIILLILFITSGLFNLIGYSYGSFCVPNVPVMSEKGSNTHLYHLEHTENIEESIEEEEKKCVLNWMSKLSLPNIKNRADIQSIHEYLNIVTAFAIMITLIFFRKSQNEINDQVDAFINSPSDYTIIVKNIPTYKNIDYKKELSYFFSEKINPEKKYNVSKVVLLWDFEDVVHLEDNIKEKIVLKKKAFKEKNQQLIKNIDKSIEKLEEELEGTLNKIEKDPLEFAGIAFISFKTEAEKHEVIEHCKAPGSHKLKDYLQGSKLHKAHGIKIQKELGKTVEIPEEGRFFQGYRLSVEEAPEPNDINWEFINSTNYEKLIVRVRSYSLYFLMLGVGFSIIFIIKYYQTMILEEILEEEHENKHKHHYKGTENKYMIGFMEFLTYLIVLFIICFNKFLVGPLLEKIVDFERISTKTRIHISFAKKMSLALFFNTALITLIIELFIFKNYYGEEGLIFTELLIVLLDIGFELVLWIVDPYTIIKNYKRNKELAKGNESNLTQKEANELMEKPSYSMSDRYADILKTMWFIFLYSGLIPLCILFFAFGLFCFYWIDKYNLLRRRTIKESISIELSTEMIELLEFILPIYGFAGMLFSYQLYDSISWQNILVLVLGILYCLLPIGDFVEILFPRNISYEVLEYEEAQLDFDNDYDRENPVTKRKSLKKWKGQRKIRTLEEITNSKLNIP